jgi:hypothetical protein
MIEDLDERAAMREMGIERIVVVGANLKYRVFFGAPVVIMVYGERVLRKTGTHHSALADCSAAIKNMQLAAFSLGLGTCWIGLLRHLFATDRCIAAEGYDPLYGLTLGYSAGPEAMPLRAETVCCAQRSRSFRTRSPSASIPSPRCEETA